MRPPRPSRTKIEYLRRKPIFGLYREEDILVCIKETHHRYAFIFRLKCINCQYVLIAGDTALNCKGQSPSNFRAATKEEKDRFNNGYHVVIDLLTKRRLLGQDPTFNINKLSLGYLNYPFLPPPAEDSMKSCHVERELVSITFSEAFEDARKTLYKDNEQDFVITMNNQVYKITAEGIAALLSGNPVNLIRYKQKLDADIFARQQNQSLYNFYRNKRKKNE